jgi:sialic acid synthase
MATVVAEIGCNHKGSLEIALELIASAAKCGAHIAKFQKRNNKECLPREIYFGPHPNPQNAYGLTYGEHREFLELSINDHYLLKKECEKYAIEYSCTPFDLTSAREILELSPAHVKISSFHNNFEKLVEFIATQYESLIHVSLGMTTIKEKTRLMEILEYNDRLDDTIIYWCTSSYPCPPHNLYLNEIIKLKEEYGSRIRGLGFSGHHDGIAMDLIALSFGATYFERHFTLDHNWKGTDHKTSLQPEGLVRLIRDLRSGELAMSFKARDITQEEEHNRNFHKYKG